MRFPGYKIGLILLIVLLFGMGGFLWQHLCVAPETDEITICSDEQVPIKIYGLTTEGKNLHMGEIEPGQNLSEILEGFGVDYRSLAELSRNAEDVFSVRKLRPGFPYTIIQDTSTNTVEYFVFEPDDRSFVVYEFRDSVHARRTERQVELVERTVVGRISSSVYLTVLKAGGSPQLVHRLVDVFAWQIDFFRIQEGDEFKVVFEEEQVDGQTVGLGRILGAYFKHFDKPYYAILFENCGQRNYLDECGNNVRRAFMKAPLNYSRISSRYSLRRFHPVLKRYRSHLGTDYAAPTGTPIRSVGSGVVVEAGYKGGNGNYVKVRHNNTYATQYLHMSKIAKGIHPGTVVAQGQEIGYVGSTGLATGPHLCFRFWKNGKQVDPFKVDLPPADSIDPSIIEVYETVRDVMKKRLDELDIPGNTEYYRVLEANAVK